MTDPVDQTARAAVEGVSELDSLIASIKPMTLEQEREQRISFVYGNVAMSNPAVTREMVKAADDVPSTRLGDWMQTFTGRAVFPLDLRPGDIDIQDIAHALSMQCRYAGHTRTFYSVAEHSVHVARWCRQYGPAAALEGLLHDATEAYLVDVPRPIKPFLVGYRDAEWRAAEVIAERFGLDARGYPEYVHEADNRILNDERAALMAPCDREWTLTDDQPLGVRIECWRPDRAKREFLALFNELYGED